MVKHHTWRGLAAALCIAVLALAGCAPTEETTVKRGPDMSPTENVKLDFVQLHNDTIDAFGDATDNPYVFISDVNVSGDNDKKTIDIDAICLDDTTKEEAEQFAAAAIRHANDSAVTQSTEYEISSQTSFGNLFDKYALKLTVRPESTKDDASTYLVNLQLQPGDSIPLNPDIETYEEDWADTRDEYLEQLRNEPVKLGGSDEETAADGAEEADRKEGAGSAADTGTDAAADSAAGNGGTEAAETQDTQTSVD